MLNVQAIFKPLLQSMYILIYSGKMDQSGMQKDSDVMKYNSICGRRFCGDGSPCKHKEVRGASQLQKVCSAKQNQPKLHLQDVLSPVSAAVFSHGNPPLVQHLFSLSFNNRLTVS